MQFPTPRCSFLQGTTPSFWSPLAQKAHPSTSNTSHFDKLLISIPIYLLLTTPSFSSPLAQKAHPSTSNTSHFDKLLISIPIYLLLLVPHTSKPEPHLASLLIA